MLDLDLPVVEGSCLVHLSDGDICFLRLRVEDVCESARHLRLMILDDVDLLNGTELGEDLPQSVFGCSFGNASNVDVAIMSRVNLFTYLLIVLLLLLLAITIRLN